MEDPEGNAVPRSHEEYDTESSSFDDDESNSAIIIDEIRNPNSDGQEKSLNSSNKASVVDSEERPSGHEEQGPTVAKSSSKKPHSRSKKKTPSMGKGKEREEEETVRKNSNPVSSSSSPSPSPSPSLPPMYPPSPSPTPPPSFSKKKKKGGLRFIRISFLRKKKDKRSKEVEKFLEETNMKLHYKVLLLGSGESGKSTVLKQLKTIYKIERTPEELLEVTCAMHVNAVENMAILCRQAEKFEFEFPEKVKQYVQTVLNCNISLEPPYENNRMTPEVAEAISVLWLTDEIQQTYERSSEFWLLDSCEYFFKNVDRFADDEYRPTEEDCIMARVRTKGILETKINQDPIEWSIIDVAGQKGARKKWVQCFDNVKCVIFLVNLAGYNSVCWEDPSKNQMQDTLELFKEIVNLPTFKNIPFYLFFNKKDLFEQMIKKFPFSNCFPQFKGLAKFANADVKIALEYLTSVFQEQLDPEIQDKKLPTIYLASRVKKDVQHSWEEVRDALVIQNKKEVDKVRKKIKKSKKQ